VSRGARDLRAGKVYPDRPGVVYLLHLSEPFGHARHYVGWTGQTADVRLAEHEAGNGGHFTALLRGAGIKFRVARQRPGTKQDEYRIKAAGGQRRYCPVCTARPFGGVWATDPSADAVE